MIYSKYYTYATRCSRMGHHFREAVIVITAMFGLCTWGLAVESAAGPSALRNTPSSAGIEAELAPLKQRALFDAIRDEWTRQRDAGTKMHYAAVMNDVRLQIAKEAIDIYERYPTASQRWDAVAIAYHMFIERVMWRSVYFDKFEADMLANPRLPLDTQEEWGKRLYAVSDWENNSGEIRQFWQRYYADEFMSSTLRKKISALGRLALTQDDLSPGALTSLVQSRIRELERWGEQPSYYWMAGNLRWANQTIDLPIFKPGTGSHLALTLMADEKYHEAKELMNRLIELPALRGAAPAELLSRTNGLTESMFQGVASYFGMVGAHSKEDLAIEVGRLEGPKTGWVEKSLIQKAHEKLGRSPNAKGTAVSFSFTAIDGRKVDSQLMLGKVVLLDFWATWCRPCIDEIPNVKAVYEKYNQLGFEIVGISLDSAEHSQRFKDLCKANGITWPQHFDGKGWQNEFAMKFGVSGLPTMMLLGKDGRVVSSRARGSALEREVRKHLGLVPLEPNAAAAK